MLWIESFGRQSGGTQSCGSFDNKSTEVLSTIKHLMDMDDKHAAPVDSPTTEAKDPLQECLALIETLELDVREPVYDGTGVGLIFDARMARHRNLSQPTHVESPARIIRIFKYLYEENLAQRCVRIPCREARREELEAKHTTSYVDAIFNVENLSPELAVQEQNKYDSVFLSPESKQAALLSAGAVLEAVERVCAGHVKSAVCVGRPPGHHAEPDRAMGFSLFGNVAVAVAEARNKGFSKRTLIVDWDVHHGNGTQKMFEQDDTVLYFSIHRYDSGSFYPQGDYGSHTSHGSGAGAYYSVNIPWNVRKGRQGKCIGPPGDPEYLEAFNQVLLPIARVFKPDLVVVSAGFDCALGDPLGDCRVTPSGFYQLTKLLFDLANGRLVLALEGGYNLNSISTSMAACVRALLRDTFPDIVEPRPVLPLYAETIECVRKHFAEFWASLRKKGVSNRAAEIIVPAAALKGSLMMETENSLLELAQDSGPQTNGTGKAKSAAERERVKTTRPQGHVPWSTTDESSRSISVLEAQLQSSQKEGEEAIAKESELASNVASLQSEFEEFESAEGTQLEIQQKEAEYAAEEASAKYAISVSNIAQLESSVQELKGAEVAARHETEGAVANATSLAASIAELEKQVEQRTQAEASAQDEASEALRRVSQLEDFAKEKEDSLSKKMIVDLQRYSRQLHEDVDKEKQRFEASHMIQLAEQSRALNILAGRESELEEKLECQSSGRAAKEAELQAKLAEYSKAIEAYDKKESDLIAKAFELEREAEAKEELMAEKEANTTELESRLAEQGRSFEDRVAALKATLAEQSQELETRVVSQNQLEAKLAKQSEAVRASIAKVAKLEAAIQEKDVLLASTGELGASLEAQEAQNIKLQAASWKEARFEQELAERDQSLEIHVGKSSELNASLDEMNKTSARSKKRVPERPFCDRRKSQGILSSPSRGSHGISRSSRQNSRERLRRSRSSSKDRGRRQRSRSRRDDRHRRVFIASSPVRKPLMLEVHSV